MSVIREGINKMKLRFSRIIALLVFVVANAGCASAINTPATAESVIGATEQVSSKESEATIITPTVARPPTPTSIPPVPLPTAGPQPVEAINSHEQRVCPSAPTVLDVGDSFQIQVMTQMDFVGEQILEVAGWVPRPLTPEQLSAPSANPSGGVITSSSVTLVAGQFNLLDSAATLRERDFAPLLLNPCPDECPFEILDQSPDDQWQLVQIRDRPNELAGVWLVSRSEKAQLVNFVPYWSKWQWALDNSLLWFIRPEPVYGLRAAIVQLEHLPVVTVPEVSEENPLHPTDYFVAFSPVDKTVLSVSNPRKRGDLDEGKLYTFALTQSLTEIASVEVIPGLQKVEWNEATQSFLLIIPQEEAIEIRERDGTITVNLPLKELYELISRMALSRNIPFQLHALSSTGDRLAITLGDGRIFVFDCQETPQP